MRIRRISDTLIRPLFGGCTVFELALVCAAAGLGEEMFFRGLLQSLLARYAGRWPALLAASVIFGLLHMITPTYAVLAALLGCYLGWIWLWTGNLLVVIIAHGLYDFLALLYLVRPSHR